jgi:hypothetical protein
MRAEDGLMRSAVGVVEAGLVRLPNEVDLPEGSKVLVQWDAEDGHAKQYLEREPLTLEEVRHDLEWVTGNRFRRPTQK